MIVKSEKIKRVVILFIFTLLFATILQTLHNIADCRTEHERTSGWGSWMR